MDLSEQNRLAGERQQITLPLSSLDLDHLNVRQDDDPKLPELAALLASQGQLQNLIVRLLPAKRGKKKAPARYGVVAGGRRFRAFGLLLEAGTITSDHPVQCLLVTDAEAVSVSLAENSGREDLHPVDQMRAFAALIAEGRTPAQVASAWGVTVNTVNRRLKLANVSPKLLTLYRQGEVSSEQLMALALVDDHALQESVWDSSSPYERSDYHLRAKLTKGSTRGNSELAVFVGVECYEAAGGAVTRDLFADDDECGVYLDDQALLLRLASEKLAEACAPIREEGWSWVDARVRFSYQDQHGFGRCYPVEREASAEEQAALDAQQEALRGVEGELDALDDVEFSEAVREQQAALWNTQERLEAELAALKGSLRVYEAADLANAGAVVTVGNLGEVRVIRGLVRKEDEAKRAKQRRAVDEAADESESDADDDASDGGDASHEGDGKPGRPAVSETLMAKLTAHRTGAVRAALADEPAIALRVLAYQLASQLLVDRYGDRADSPVEIRLSSERLEAQADDYEGSQAQSALSALQESLGERLPGSRAKLIDWCLKADDTTIMSVLAYCTAMSLNMVRRRAGDRPPVAAAIESALGLDMRDWWAPTAQSYLGAVTKASIFDAVLQGAGAEALLGLDALKKQPLIAAAERALDGRGWLPGPLRAYPSAVASKEQQQ